jgi:hypothetical protein
VAAVHAVATIHAAVHAAVDAVNEHARMPIAPCMALVRRLVPARLRAAVRASAGTRLLATAPAACVSVVKRANVLNCGRSWAAGKMTAAGAHARSCVSPPRPPRPPPRPLPGRPDGCCCCVEVDGAVCIVRGLTSAVARCALHASLLAAARKIKVLASACMLMCKVLQKVWCAQQVARGSCPRGAKPWAWLVQVFIHGGDGPFERLSSAQILYIHACVLQGKSSTRGPHIDA